MWKTIVRQLLVASLVVSGMALAECDEATSHEPAGLEGKWRFKTTGDYEGYVNGSLRIEAEGSVVTLCRLTVFQSEFGSAIETCRIDIDGEDVTIFIEDIVTSSVPNWRKEVFHLTWGEAEMVGTVLIVVDFPVLFTKRK